VIRAVSEAAGQTDLRLHKRQAEGDPVALISLAQPSDDDEHVMRVETVRLGDGEIYVAGSTEAR